MELYNMPFYLSIPVNSIFNAVDDLMELSDHAGIPMTSNQSVNFAYDIFARQPILLQDLRAWHNKPAADKTWTNTKTHLREAQDDLSSLPVAGSMFPNTQQANFTAITDMVSQRFLQEQASLAHQQLHELYTPPPSFYQTLDGTAATPPPAQEPVTPTYDQSVLADQFSAMANSIQRRESDLQTREQQMLTQMQKMMSRMFSQNSGSKNRNRNNNRSSGRGGRGGRNSSYGDCTQTTRSSSTHKYCWTHGYCAHVVSECNTKADGHQVQATVTNMLNSSNANCYWLPT